MNGLEKIIEKILTDAKTSAQLITDEAKIEAEAILEEADKKAEAERIAVLARGTERADAIERQAVSNAQLDARKQLLAKKQSLIAEAFSASYNKLLSLDEKTYLDLLCKLAADNSVSGNEQILLNPKDHDSIGEQVAKGANKRLTASGHKSDLTLSNETRSISGGLFLSDGDIETNCTFEAIIQMLRETLATEVANTLFPSENETET